MLRGYFRAPRFPIHMSLRYRMPGESAWLEGKTENISRSGVLFHTSAPLEVNTPIEVGLELPVEAGGEPGKMMLCQACVVRTLPPAASDAPPTMAAKFLQYRIVREEHAKGFFDWIRRRFDWTSRRRE
jgi:hypothetical protein